MSVAEKIAQYQQRIEKVLNKKLPDATIEPSLLHQAMRYSVLNGGKRIRPLLVYAAGECFQTNKTLLDAPAAAIELLHAYSLVHDDLPSMDDDDLRRGKATAHKAFDESTAILSGDALQTLAFDVLSSPLHNLSSKNQLKIINILSQTAGSLGMVGGQVIDLSSTGKNLSEQQLENMHLHKTGALIRASVMMGATCSEKLTVKLQTALEKYAICIGLAFQVRDDILDIESDTATLGKQQGADIAANKATYPAILGMTAAKEKMLDLYASSYKALSCFGAEADLLRNIADFIVKRVQ
ncbi:MAG TPA: geranyl transferase [Leucothrix mucor]|uniref:Geranyl transferase n=1 Tax=Leucothrix mucor TaxID=45248 RepID=A0A7V2WUS4_LEUMU|nr:geranyl transferase [Leucothrix mucor]